jgi:hypothetical protein
VNEPLGGGSAAALVFGAGLLNIVFAQDPAVVMCAFFGAVVFVLSAKESSRAERVVFLIVSMLVGVVGADFAADMMSDLLPGSYPMPPSIAALAVSTVAVRVMQWAIRWASNPQALRIFGGPKQ